MALACAGKTTSLGYQDEPERVDPITQPVACASFVDNGGGQLVDPPSSCVATYSSCTDDHIYELHCDGLSCTCLFDGWPQAELPGGTIYTPRCLDRVEAALRCGWPIGWTEGTTFSFGAIQGALCSNSGEHGGCTCENGRQQCPGIGGCNVVGNYVPEAGQLPVLHFLHDGTFHTAEVTASATFAQVVANNAQGAYGTWALQGDVLSVRSYEFEGSSACTDEPGRYVVSFNDACELEELSLLEDPCEPRRALATRWTPWEP